MKNTGPKGRHVAGMCAPWPPNGPDAKVRPNCQHHTEKRWKSEVKMSCFTIFQWFGHLPMGFLMAFKNAYWPFHSPFHLGRDIGPPRVPRGSRPMDPWITIHVQTRCHIPQGVVPGKPFWAKNGFIQLETDGRGRSAKNSSLKLVE